MRLFITGDLHFNKNQFHYLKQTQNEYDVLCLTGDLLDLKNDSFEVQTQWIADFLRTFDKPVLLCSGNHDIDDECEFKWLNNVSDNIMLDNHKRVFGKLKFGSVSYFCPDFSEFSDCDVLLHHVPPKYSKIAVDSVSGEDWGDEFIYEALRDKVITPTYLLCGHVENPVKQKEVVFETTVINAGAEHTSDIPKIYQLNI